MHSTSTDHSDWSSHPARRNDHPFSTRGRFNRLSYLGWYGFFNLLPIALLLLLHFGLGVIRLDLGTLYDHGFALWLDGSGWLLLAGTLLFIYLHLLLIIRRLHDINHSGWWSLLFLLPVIQWILLLYLLIAPGSSGVNDYGPPRPSRFLEKLMGWLVVLMFVMSILVFGQTMHFMMSTGNIDLQHLMLKSHTGYF
ncbi:DUF805 domain-containing protein [Acinetobacter soli]|uniref:DUF805 domain-containing protein n=1 Tax=Acinetobacter soli TaxID=487316 RepID=UPI001250B057|nr:DUF805 domain-containing protein [Acinetobacter soli]MEB4799773.1 DUF805 domain-containing protein [Acinetobacter soli]